MSTDDYLKILEEKLSERPERQEKSKKADAGGIGSQGGNNLHLKN